MRDNGREQTGSGENRRERNGPILACSRLLSAILAHSFPFSTMRALLGMPDYDSYCTHLRVHHPERPLPSEREFFDQFVRARYGDGPTRCC
jgi:uncharacterized short protein YbdD (DUF466 family)